MPPPGSRETFLRMVGERYRGDLERIVADASFYLPSGCPKCGGTGFSGRMALIELLPSRRGYRTSSRRRARSRRSCRAHGGGFILRAQSVQEMLQRGMVTYEDVAPFFR